MNRKIGLVALMIGVAFPLSVRSAECNKLAQYSVEKTNFSKLPLELAVGKLLKGTPLKVRMAGMTGLSISANDVSGPLDVVLSKMAEGTGFSYSQENCVVLVRGVDKDGQASEVWSAKTGDMVKATLESWANMVDWQVSWETPDDYAIGGNASYAGGFEEAVESIMKSVKFSNPSLNHKFFYGNRMLRVWSGQESNAAVKGDSK